MAEDAGFPTTRRRGASEYFVSMGTKAFRPLRGRTMGQHVEGSAAVMLAGLRRDGGSDDARIAGSAELGYFA